MGRKRCGKGRNFSLRAISSFPAVFSKDLYYRQVKTRAFLNKSGKLSQDTPVLPQVVKLGHAPDKIQV